MSNGKKMTEPDYGDDVVFLANTSTQADFLLHSFEQAIRGNGVYVNANKIEFMCFIQVIFTWNGKLLKLVDQCT